MRGRINSERKPELFPWKLYLLVIVSVMCFIRTGDAVTAKESPPLRLTAEESQWLEENHHRLYLYYNTEFPPIEFAANDGSFTGMGSDVIKAVEKRLGLVFNKQPCPDWNKHLAALKNGECAIAPTIVPNKARRKYIYFSSPYAKVPVVIISTKSSGDNLTIKDLIGKKVAIVSGYATEKYLEEKSRGKIQIVKVKNVYNGLRSTAFGQVDAFVENLAVAAYYIHQEGIPNLQVSGTTDYFFEWSIGVSRKYPLLYSSIEKALVSIDNEELKKIRKKWISLELPEGLSPETLFMIQFGGFILFLILIVLSGMSYILRGRLREKVLNLKMAQDELIEQGERLRVATEAIDAVVWDYYPSSDNFVFGDEWLDILGYKKNDFEEESGNLWDKLVHPEDNEVVKKSVEQYVNTGGEGEFEVEFRMLRARGNWCWFLCKGRTIARDENGNPERMIGLNLSIQKMKEVQEKLEESEEKFRSLFTMAPIPMAKTSMDGNIIMVNQRFEQIIGYSIDDIPTLDKWWQLAYPDEEYRECAKENWNNAVINSGDKSDVASHEFRVVCRDGTEKLMIIGASVIGDNFLTSFTDITELRKGEEERERLREQLLQSQKLEAIGILAGGIAHDFNNLLGGIMGYTQITMNKMDNENPLKKNLRKIMDASQRSSTLVKQLLTFARRETVDPVPLDVNSSVDGMLKMIGSLIGENIELVWHPGELTSSILIDPSQFDQILTNLCVNARDAIDGTGRVSIETASVCLDAKFRIEKQECTPGEYVMLSISDDGKGMDRQTREHAFEPFFTTKEKGRGTGLGLATVYGIVKQNSGFVDLYSEPGHGTIVKIYLPSIRTKTIPSAESANEDIPSGKGETILIVEDDSLMRETTQILLEDLGYSVMTAGTPEDALEMVKSEYNSIDLLITDVIMPQMNGRELADRIHELYPDVRILFMSGYTDDIIARQGIIERGALFIQKPFSAKGLANKIRDILKQGF